MTMTEKKQTAVMWLIEQQANMPNLLHGHPTLEEYQRVKEDIINKALQMEEYQIERAFDDGYCNGKDDPNNFNEQYYTDTYGE